MNNPSTHTDDSFTLKEKIGYTLLSVVVLGGSFFIGRSLIRKAVSNSEEKKTFQEGNPADYAQRLKMAFENNGWPGTDMDAVRAVILSIPSKEEFRKVINSYEKLYTGSSLMRDLKDKLKTTRYNEVLAILATKPDRGTTLTTARLSLAQYQSWAKRLKAAFDITYGIFPGTDEPAIKAVFMEIPTQAAFQQVAVVYKNMYGNDLINDLKSELEFWEYGPMMAIISSKPKA